MFPSDGGGSLFLSPIPVPPGDPGSLSGAAGKYTAAHGEIVRQQALLKGAAGQAAGAAWTGVGAANYEAATTDLVAVYGLTAAALAKGATALKTFSSDLSSAQKAAHQANTAVATSNAAARAYLSAQSAAEQAQTEADDATTASTTAANHANANPHSAPARQAADTAQTTANDKQSSATAASGRASALLSQYEADYSRAVTLCTQAQTEAHQAVTKAGTAFNAATTDLMGKSAKPVPGGAKPVPGGSPWTATIDALATGNNWAGPLLNGWGAFGAVVLTKAGTTYLEAQADLGKAADTYDTAIDAVLSKQGFFSSGFYNAQDAYNAAAGANSKAFTGLQDAIRPAVDDPGLMALVGKAGLGVGMLSDGITLVAPSPSFGPGGVLGGNTDRGLAAANLAASGLALGSSLDVGLATTAMAIPGVDVVVGGVLIGTAAYFAGEYVYQHWGGITHAVDGALNAAGSWAGHEVDKLTSTLTNPLSWL
jgi:hypothetical protein